MKTLPIFILSLALGSLTHSVAGAADLAAAISSDSRDVRLQSRGEFKPAQVMAHKLVYEFGELQLRPGQVIYLSVPTEGLGSVLDEIEITHKQDPRDENECASPNPKWDCLPAYTSVEILDQNAKILNGDMWRYWGGPGSGPFNSKFAEIRTGEGETDSLFEWQRYGHLGTSSKVKTRDALHISGLRIRSVGPDTVILQKLIVKLAPPVTTDFQDIIFARGLDFGDYATARGRRYAGNSDIGYYGTALVLENTHGRQVDFGDLPDAWSFQGDVLNIPLDDHKAFQSLDIACGDMSLVPQGADANDYRGDGKLTVKYVHADGSKETLMERENVGSTGVMRALPLQNINFHGGHLEVFANQGQVKVMGLRLAYASTL